MTDAAAPASQSPARYVVLDLETIVDPALPPEHRGPLDEPRVPAPIHCQIVAATGLVLRADYSVAGMRTFTDERQAIASNIVTLRGRVAVTWNGRGFDLPVLAARAFVHGLQFPHYYDASAAGFDMRSRYKGGRHLDLCDYLADYGSSRPARLEAYARACGFPGKVDGVSGADVATMVAAGRMEDVAQYNAEDVAQTTAVFLRTQLIRGAITPEEYREVMRNFMAWCDGQPVLSRVMSMVNRARALDVG